MNKIIAIASSTGGPKALNAIIPQLPEDLQVPVVIVQHMPLKFTKTFSMRLDEISKVKVVEAADGMKLQSGHVYIAKAGTHLNIIPRGSEHYIADSTYGYPANIFDWGTSRDNSAFTRAENMNPLGIHDKLTAHPAYLRNFADSIQRIFFE